MAKLPWFKFFPTDYLGDQDIALLPLDAQALWFRMVCVMYGTPKKGFLAKKNGAPMTPEELGRLSLTSAKDVGRLLPYLVSEGIFSRTGDGVVYCRRIVKVEQITEERKKAGRAGGLARQANIDDFAKAKPQANNQAKDLAKVFVNGQAKGVAGCDSKSVVSGYLASSSCISEELMGEAGEERESAGESNFGPFAGEAEFEFFWDQFPKEARSKKPFALRAWRAAMIASSEMPAIMDGLARHKTSSKWSNDNGRYIDSPTNFINGKMWNDNPRQATADEKKSFGDMVREEVEANERAKNGRS